MKKLTKKMRKGIITAAAVVPLAFAAGCGGSLGSTDDTADLTDGTATDNEIISVAVVGSGATNPFDGDADAQEFTDQTQADMNAKIMEAVSQKVEAAINDELMAMEEEAAMDPSAAKDISVGLGDRGLSLFIEDEVVPFAGGTMTLNGEVGLRLKFHSWSKLSLIASGELTSQLEGVERSGLIRDIPYSLSLDGSNDMEMEGAFTAQIKRWRIKSLKADLSSSIVDSDVVASGTIGDRAASGAVNMVDVSVRAVNNDVLANGQAFDMSCTGTVETMVNDDVIAACQIDPSCKGCQ